MKHQNKINKKIIMTIKYVDKNQLLNCQTELLNHCNV